MIVTIWRHGEAGRAATDRQRELTDRGLDDIGFGCQQFLKGLVGRGMVPPDLILYSPWIRTWQTGEIVAATFTHASAREHQALQPGSTITEVDHCLSALHDDAAIPSHVVLVSHQPLVSQLVEYYLGRATDVPPLSPGGLVTFALQTPARDCGELSFWAVPPEYEAGP